MNRNEERERRLRFGVGRNRFTLRTELILKEAGWFEGRNGCFTPPSFPDTPDWELFPLAQKILHEFSGLTIKQQGIGFEHGYSSERIKFNAEIAWYSYDYGQRYLHRFGKRLYPLGEMGAPYLFIDEEEVMVMQYFVNEKSGVVGQGFDASLERLLLGLGNTIKGLTI